MVRYVKVVWMDAAHGGEWYTTDQLPAPDTVTSTGWIAYEGDKHIVLAASHYGDDAPTWGQTIAIPTGMILTMEDFDG